MPTPFYIFPTPLTAHCELTPDSGSGTIVAVPATHPSGRAGQVFQIPDTVPQGQGAQLIITADGKVTEHLRGILWLTAPSFPWTTGLMVDDFHLANANITLPRLVPQGEFLAQDIN